MATTALHGHATHRSAEQTRHLLTAAAIVGPLFYISSTVQALTRDGFDLRVHPLSQLATGDLGWIHAVTFVLAGLGVLGLAVAQGRVVTDGVGSRVAPVFLGIFGAAFAVAGCFPMDPQNGFPIGAPAGAVDMSWHAVVHSAAAILSFVALAAACITLLIRALRARHMRAAVGHGITALVMLLPVSPSEASLQIAATGLVAFTWVTVYSLALRRAQ
ncbi:conserved membrane hypothetical protein [Rhodococcus sp. RD6.2]|jgi:hypothetical protein|uniref:DUF998 domain-containing protein n=1 Tax=Rhodococcus sp. RD6.2 TaxID=260936 RepID=UPI00063B5E3F|nr:DUF998 domain-containing protein [Rhodococcus sp. RD6.2]CRK50811.1 conserved membrane hypothetical protein [Rhodococcus sp. RD6.2]